MLTIHDFTQKLPRHDSRKWALRSITEISELVVHQSFSDLDDIQDLAKYYVSTGCHVDNLGCPTFPYTYAIATDGTIYQCNVHEALTWHFGDSPWRGDFERKFLSVCVLGDLQNHPPSRKQTIAFLELLDHLTEKYPNLGLHGHCHWGKASCPGSDLTTLIHQFRGKDEGSPRSTSPFGNSRASVTKYQVEHQLRVSGIVDYDTVRSLLKV